VNRALSIKAPLVAAFFLLAAALFLRAASVCAFVRGLLEGGAKQQGDAKQQLAQQIRSGSLALADALVLLIKLREVSTEGRALLRLNLLLPLQ